MKDTLFQSTDAVGNFAFDDAVAAVFPDMIRRSVPGYATVIAGTGLAAGLYAQPGSNIYDLGCSVGASSYAISQHVDTSQCQVIAIDNSPAMLDQLKNQIQSLDSMKNIELVCADILEASIENASVVILNYTLQFIPVEHRDALLEKIHAGMNTKGVLLLSEKIAFADETEQARQIALHEAFKKEQGYTDLEISRKRTALENVLVPETLQTHYDRLQRIGFVNTQQWFRCFNFTSLLAWKS